MCPMCIFGWIVGVLVFIALVVAIIFIVKKLRKP